MNDELIKKVELLADRLKGKSAEEVIAEVTALPEAKNIALASSLGLEDQALTHMLRTGFPDVKIFTIDTGRLPQETYDVMQATMDKYGFRYEVLFPDAGEIARLTEEYGPNMFYKSVQLRRKCCEARKVLPLKKKLSGLSAWICGLRKEQAVTRTDIKTLEWDYNNNLIKANPLADWTTERVWKYIKDNNVPYNKLNDMNYPSIGCLPCTRAVKNGEDIRAGRWWWESPEHKECGLHKQRK